MDFTATSPDYKNVPGMKQKRTQKKMAVAQTKNYDIVCEAFGVDQTHVQSVAELLPRCQSIYEAERH